MAGQIQRRGNHAELGLYDGRLAEPLGKNEAAAIARRRLPPDRRWTIMPVAVLLALGIAYVFGHLEPQPAPPRTRTEVIPLAEVSWISAEDRESINDSIFDKRFTEAWASLTEVLGDAPSPTDRGLVAAGDTLITLAQHASLAHVEQRTAWFTGEGVLAEIDEELLDPRAFLVYADDAMSSRRFRPLTSDRMREATNEFRQGERQEAVELGAQMMRVADRAAQLARVARDDDDRERRLSEERDLRLLAGQAYLFGALWWKDGVWGLSRGRPHIDEARGHAWDLACDQLGIATGQISAGESSLPAETIRMVHAFLAAEQKKAKSDTVSIRGRVYTPEIIHKLRTPGDD